MKSVSLFGISFVYRPTTHYLKWRHSKDVPIEKPVYIALTQGTKTGPVTCHIFIKTLESVWLLVKNYKMDNMPIDQIT